jgi:predicted small lipoprotein YifL
MFAFLAAALLAGCGRRGELRLPEDTDAAGEEGSDDSDGDNDGN